MLDSGGRVRIFSDDGDMRTAARGIVKGMTRRYLDLRSAFSRRKVMSSGAEIVRFRLDRNGNLGLERDVVWESR